MNKRSPQNATPLLTLRSLRDYCSRVPLPSQPPKTTPAFATTYTPKSQSTKCLPNKRKVSQKSNYQLRVGRTRQELISITTAKIYLPLQKVSPGKGQTIRSLRSCQKPRCLTSASDWFSPTYTNTPSPNTFSFFEDKQRNTTSHISPPRRPSQNTVRPTTASHPSVPYKGPNLLKSIEVQLPTRHQSHRPQSDPPISAWQTSNCYDP